MLQFIGFYFSKTVPTSYVSKSTEPTQHLITGLSNAHGKQFQIFPKTKG